MFESLGTGKSLDEDVFEAWLEKGRTSHLGYLYLLIVWHAGEEEFHPVFVGDREAIQQYSHDIAGHEQLVAAYDLFSESRVSWE